MPHTGGECATVRVGLGASGDLGNLEALNGGQVLPALATRNQRDVFVLPALQPRVGSTTLTSSLRVCESQYPIYCPLGDPETWKKNGRLMASEWKLGWPVIGSPNWKVPVLQKLSTGFPKCAPDNVMGLTRNVICTGVSCGKVPNGSCATRFMSALLRIPVLLHAQQPNVCRQDYCHSRVEITSFLDQLLDHMGGWVTGNYSR